jgi:membrane fusion protein (multidrug efflux system)
VKRVSRIVAAGVIVCLSILAILSFVLIFGRTDETIEGYGNISPLHYIDIAPEQSGIITEVRIGDGDTVNAGDTLVLIYDDDLRLEVQQAKLLLNQDISRLDQAQERYRNLDESESFETSAELANLHRARAECEYYKSEYERKIKLHEKGFISDSELKLAKYQYDMAREYLIALEKRLEMLRAEYLRQIDEGPDNIEVRKHIYDLAHKKLEKCVITSPIAGTVTAPDIKYLVGTMAVEGQPLFRICDLNQMGFIARISENDIARIKIGQEVRLFINAFPHRQYGIIDGAVTDIPSLALTMEDGVGYEVRIAIDSPWVVEDSMRIHFVTGMTGRAEVVIKKDVRLIARFFEGVSK